MPTIEQYSGREAVTIVEIQQPLCGNVFGGSPCAATGEKCFNTRATCRDNDNFALGEPLSLFFSTGTVAGRLDVEYEFDESGNLVLDADQQPVIAATSTNPKYIIPSLVSVSTSPTKINLAGSSQNAQGLGNRAVCNIKFKDMTHTDRIVDPYLLDRAGDPSKKSSFWRKWGVRNKYRQNVKIKIYEGYLGQPLSAMRVRTYFLQSFSGVDSNGNVTIQGKDILARLEERKAQAPLASNGVLYTDIDSAVDSFEVTNAALSEYESAGTVIISNEIMTYSSVVESTNGLTFSGVVRGTDGSVADEHSLDDTVQQCLRFDNEKIPSGVQRLLTDFAGVEDVYFADWSYEADNYLASYRLNGLVVKPTAVSSLVSEIQLSHLFFIWWDERRALIDIKAIRGISETPPLLTAESNILADSMRITEKPAERISQAWIYYGMKDRAGGEKDPKNFNAFIRADLDSEDDTRYGEASVRKIFARFLGTKSLARNTATKMVVRHVETPRSASFSLDAKDRGYWIGDIVQISHDDDIDEFGDRVVSYWMIVSAEENIDAGTIQYLAEDTTLYGQIKFITASDADDYDTNAPKNTLCYIGNADGLLSDGTKAGIIG